MNRKFYFSFLAFALAFAATVAFVIGGNLNQTISTSRRDPSSVIVARGSFKADELLNTGFAAAAKECTFDKEEQQYEGRTIFLVSNVRLCKKEGSSGTSDKTAQPD